MKKFLSMVGLVALLATPAMANEPSDMHFGLDFAMPYTLRANGASVNTRGNFNLGLDGRYFYTENINFGTRLYFDIEARGVSVRQFGLMPGVQYHWMPGERWNPFVRFDLPITLRGAPNTAASKTKQDVGIAAGAGLAWNLGDAIGIENMSVRYDFAFQYYFGLSTAVNVLAIDIFKIGFDYKF